MERSGEGLPWVRSSGSSKEHSRVTFFWAERSLEGSAPASPPSAQPARPAVPTRVGGCGGETVQQGAGRAQMRSSGLPPRAAPDLHLPMASSTPVRAGGAGAGGASPAGVPASVARQTFRPASRPPPPPPRPPVHSATATSAAGLGPLCGTIPAWLGSPPTVLLLAPAHCHPCCGGPPHAPLPCAPCSPHY